MEGPLLFVLLLPWVFGSATTTTTTSPEGELCRAWNYGVDSMVGAFQCPERLGDSDAKFCCGTCSAPYCCSSGEARLDQTQCSLAAPEEGEASIALLPYLKAPPPASETNESVFNACIWAALSFLAIILCNCFCYFSSENLNRLTNWYRRGTCLSREPVEEQPTELEDLRPAELEDLRPAELEDLRPATRPRTRATRDPRARRTWPLPLDPPPSYESCLPSDPPPPYSAEDPLGSLSVQYHRSDGTREDEVAIVTSEPLPLAPLPSRRRPSHSLVPIGETETMETEV